MLPGIQGSEEDKRKEKRMAMEDENIMAEVTEIKVITKTTPCRIQTESTCGNDFQRKEHYAQIHCRFFFPV